VNEAPNRLVDWLKESWNLWRLAHDKPEIKAQVPPELQITELSRMCKVVLAQLPVCFFFFFAAGPIPTLRVV
jgi:hypothetical protein